MPNRQMKILAVIDTNVLVSALFAKRTDSAPVVIVEKIFGGTVVPVFSKEILEEYSAVLHRDKFGFDAATVDSFLRELFQTGLLLEPAPVDAALPDLKDVPFYAVTLSSGADKTYLVTGNLKHFPVKPFVVTPAGFLEILRNLS